MQYNRLILVLLFACFCSLAQAQKSKSKIVDNGYDFGTVENWDNPPALFTVVNRDKTPLVFLKTYPKQDIYVDVPKSIPPGGTGLVKIYFFTPIAGHFSQSIPVYINNREKPLKFKFSGNIKSFADYAYTMCPGGPPPKKDKTSYNQVIVVYDKRTGEPLKNVTVRISGEEKKTGKTNDNGQLKVDLRMGHYVLETDKNGYYDYNGRLKVQPGVTRGEIYIEPFLNEGSIVVNEKSSDTLFELDNNVPIKEEPKEEIYASVETPKTPEPKIEPKEESKPKKETPNYRYSSNQSNKPKPVSKPKETPKRNPTTVAKNTQKPKQSTSPKQPNRPVKKEGEETLFNMDDFEYSSTGTEVKEIDKTVDTSISEVEMNYEPTYKSKVEEVTENQYLQDESDVRTQAENMIGESPSTVKRVPKDNKPTELDDDSWSLDLGERPNFDKPIQEEKPKVKEEIKSINIPRNTNKEADSEPIVAINQTPKTPETPRIEEKEEFSIVEDEPILTNNENLPNNNQNEPINQPKGLGDDPELAEMQRKLEEAQLALDEMNLKVQEHQNGTPITQNKPSRPIKEVEKEEEIAQNNPPRNTTEVFFRDEPKEIQEVATQTPKRAKENEIVEKPRQIIEPIDDKRSDTSALVSEVLERQQREKEAIALAEKKEQEAFEQENSIEIEFDEAPAVPYVELSKDKYTENNIVFLIDVSRSMRDKEKLPLLKKSMKELTKILRDIDLITVITYSHELTTVLQTTKADLKDSIYTKIDSLVASGRTFGLQGMELAYKTIEQSYLDNGNNQIILATDGEFSNPKFDEKAMFKLVYEKSKDNIAVSVIGFGQEKAAQRTLKKIASNGKGSYLHIENDGQNAALVDEIKLRSKRF